jgi:hypothetical protein
MYIKLGAGAATLYGYGSIIAITVNLHGDDNLKQSF